MRRYFGFKSMLPQMGAPMARAKVVAAAAAGAGAGGRGFLFTLATTPKNSAKHPKMHKNDPDTTRLAPTGNCLNVTITVNKSSHLLSK